jgi:hypothetical protein
MVDMNVYPTRSPDAIGQIIDDEAVIVLPGKGKVKVLNDVGARIWSLVDGIRNINQIASVISQEYDVDKSQADIDTLEFISLLHDVGIVGLSQTPLKNNCE